MTKEEFDKLPMAQKRKLYDAYVAQVQGKGQNLESSVEGSDITGRTRIKNFAANPDSASAVKFYSEKNPNLEFKVIGNEIQFRDKGTSQKFKPIDPFGFNSLKELVNDVGDIATDVGQSFVSVPAALGKIATFGAGVPATAAIEGSIEAARQGIGSAIGIDDNFDPSLITTAAAFGGGAKALAKGGQKVQSVITWLQSLGGVPESEIAYLKNNPQIIESLKDPAKVLEEINKFTQRASSASYDVRKSIVSILDEAYKNGGGVDITSVKKALRDHEKNFTGINQASETALGDYRSQLKKLLTRRVEVPQYKDVYSVPNTSVKFTGMDTVNQLSGPGQQAISGVNRTQLPGANITPDVSTGLSLNTPSSNKTRTVTPDEILNARGTKDTAPVFDDLEMQKNKEFTGYKIENQEIPDVLGGKEAFELQQQMKDLETFLPQGTTMSSERSTFQQLPYKNARPLLEQQMEAAIPDAKFGRASFRDLVRADKLLREAFGRKDTTAYKALSNLTSQSGQIKQAELNRALEFLGVNDLPEMATKLSAAKTFANPAFNAARRTDQEFAQSIGQGLMGNLGRMGAGLLTGPASIKMQSRVGRLLPTEKEQLWRLLAKPGVDAERE